MTAPSSDIAFSPAVRAVQKRRGSRKGYERMEAKGGFRTTIDANLAQFIASMRSFYIATASKDLMDYENRQRVKIWGTARVVDEDQDLIAKLFPEGYKARAEAAIIFKVQAWDANCPQHIPQMLFAEDVAGAIGILQDRMAMLEAENARLRA